MFKGRYFANIIESPSEADRTADRSEGKVLTAALDLIGMPYYYSNVTNYKEFMHALGRHTVEGVKHHKRLPVLHLSMHGSPEGLVLTDGHFLTWGDLNWKFRAISHTHGRVLIVCLSSCYGLAGLRMIRGETAHGILEREPPFRLLVSNVNPVPWSDAAIAFATFYHLIERDQDWFQTVSAMRIASGNADFFGLLAGTEIGDQVFVLGSESLVKAVDEVAE